MSAVEEIEAAIRSLTPEERAQLADSIPALLPELDGDAEWKRILNDPKPRLKLERFLDGIDARYQANPERFPLVRESDFDPKA